MLPSMLVRMYGHKMRFASKHLMNLVSRSLFETALELILPAACLACDTRIVRQGGLCPACWGRLHFIERPYCEVLGMPFPHDHGEGAVSPAAMADPPPFDRLRACVVYDEVARALVSGLKFADRGDLVPGMTNWMVIAGRELLPACDLVVPVPLHWRRLHQRRYNQSAELGRALARQTDKAFAPQVLQRHRATDRQIGLSASARARNVAGAFRVPSAFRDAVKGRRILLVDDVYTTGATVKACAGVLRRAGAAGIDVLTFAMVRSGDI